MAVTFNGGGFCYEVIVMSGKSKLRRLMWRIKAELKRLKVKMCCIRSKKQERFSFQYDPLSYALNFDDGDFGFFC